LVTVSARNRIAGVLTPTARASHNGRPQIESDEEVAEVTQGQLL
jgi:hypothetical protein